MACAPEVGRPAKSSARITAVLAGLLRRGGEGAAKRGPRSAGEVRAARVAGRAGWERSAVCWWALGAGRPSGLGKRRGIGLGRSRGRPGGSRAERGEGLGRRVWAAVGLKADFFFGFFLSKFNSISYFYFKQSLNSNENLNSNHTQTIKTMHQHECNTQKKI